MEKAEYEGLRAYKLQCLAYAKTNFQGKSFFNADKRIWIAVSRTGLDEWFSKTKTLAQAESIIYLGDMLEKSVYTHTAKNDHLKKGDECSTFDYFSYRLEIGKARYESILTIKKVQGRGAIYYHHYLDDIKIKPPASILQP